METKDYFFTSESVTEGHPDKIADQISDAILDAILADDPVGRVACETLVTTGLALIAGEITTKTWVDIPSIVRQTIREVGYTRAKYGFDYETCAVISAIHEQSPDIAQGVEGRGIEKGEQGASATRVIARGRGSWCSRIKRRESARIVGSSCTTSYQAAKSASPWLSWALENTADSLESSTLWRSRKTWPKRKLVQERMTLA